MELVVRVAKAFLIAAVTFASVWSMGGSTPVVVNVNAPVYGVDHLERVVAEAVRSYNHRNGRAA